MVRMPHWPIPLGNKPVDLGLERVRALLEAVGNPHKTLPPIVHFAGTNGKGSSLAFLKAILMQANYKVHTYTSPHLVLFNERINLCGEDISDNFLYEIIEECRIAAESINLKPTFFEGTTVAAFLAFSRIPADILLIETGLGGRLDATNVFDNPALTVLTSISLDHTEFLGDHVTKIAYEKAGIMKRETPCVVSNQYPDVFAVIEKKANEIDVPLIAYEYDWVVEERKQGGFLYKSIGKNLVIDKLSLVGEHQFINAGNAITAALNLLDFNISDEAIIKGLNNTYWPARLQKLKTGAIVNKLPDNWQLWVDGAHNIGGAHILSLWMQHSSVPIYAIVGITRGRDSTNFLRVFSNYVTFVVGVKVDAEPSSYSAEHMANSAKEAGMASYAADSLQDAIDLVIKEAKTPGIILVCGSLFLAGDLLFKNQGKR
jgi:dihydrofolate synthase / folylpolyglutamate synthase